jgi:hypothetical protein
MIRRTGIISMLGLTSFLCCGMTAPDGCKDANKGPSVVGPAIGVGAAVAVAVAVPIIISHNKHNIHGCVFQGAEGLEVQDAASDGSSFKNYALVGNTAEIKIGDLVKLHGKKLKHSKDSSGAQAFTVDTVSKDYGPCKIPPTVTGDSKPADAPKA